MPMIGLGEIFIILMIVGFGLAIFLFAIVLALVLSRRSSEPAQTAEGRHRLLRITQRRALGGVCAGFAYVLGWPTWLARVIAICFLVISGPVGILIYIVLWVFMPRSSELPSDFESRTQRF